MPSVVPFPVRLPCRAAVWPVEPRQLPDQVDRSLYSVSLTLEHMNDNLYVLNLTDDFPNPQRPRVFKITSPALEYVPETMCNDRYAFMLTSAAIDRPEQFCDGNVTVWQVDVAVDADGREHETDKLMRIHRVFKRLYANAKFTQAQPTAKPVLSSTSTAKRSKSRSRSKRRIVHFPDPELLEETRCVDEFCVVSPFKTSPTDNSAEETCNRQTTVPSPPLPTSTTETSPPIVLPRPRLQPHHPPALPPPPLRPRLGQYAANQTSCVTQSQQPLQTNDNYYASFPSYTPGLRPASGLVCSPAHSFTPILARPRLRPPVATGAASPLPTPIYDCITTPSASQPTIRAPSRPGTVRALSTAQPVINIRPPLRSVTIRTPSTSPASVSTTRPPSASQPTIRPPLRAVTVRALSASDPTPTVTTPSASQLAIRATSRFVAIRAPSTQQPIIRAPPTSLYRAPCPIVKTTSTWNSSAPEYSDLQTGMANDDAVADDSSSVFDNPYIHSVFGSNFKSSYASNRLYLSRHTGFLSPESSQPGNLLAFKPPLNRSWNVQLEIDRSSYNEHPSCPFVKFVVVEARLADIEELLLGGKMIDLLNKYYIRADDTKRIDLLTTSQIYNLYCVDDRVHLLRSNGDVCTVGTFDPAHQQVLVAELSSSVQVCEIRSASATHDCLNPPVKILEDPALVDG